MEYGSYFISGRQYCIGISFNTSLGKHSEGYEAFVGVKTRADPVIIGFVRFWWIVRRGYEAFGGVEK